MGANKPTKLIIIGGFAGSGKTTASRRLAREMGLPRLEIDHFGKELMGMPELSDFCNSEKYALAYKLAFGLVRDYIGNKQSVILDNNMCNPLSWEEVGLIKNCEKLIFLLKCPFELCRQRANLRYLTSPHETLISGKNLETQKHKWDFVEGKKASSLIVIDASRTSQQVYQDIVDKLAD